MDYFAKIIKILSKAEKIKLTIIISMMIIAMFIEALSISLVFPILTLITSEGSNYLSSESQISKLILYFNYLPSINFFLNESYSLF